MIHDGSCEHGAQECVPCFQKRMRSISVAASATPSRKISRRGDRPPTGIEPKNSWERGKGFDARGMPVLDSNGNHVSIKQAAETRHLYRAPREQIAVD